MSSPLRLGPREPYLGAIVVAKPTAELRDRWTTLIERLLLAGLVGLAVAAALGFYLSRRITKPVEALAEAANQIAEGRYDVDIPPVRSRDEIGHLGAVRRDGHAAAGGRGARAQLPDDGLARAPHAADRDQRPCRGSP